MTLCLACGSTLGDSLFTINAVPLVDSFCETRAQALNVPRYDLDLRQCLRCLTIQINSPPDTTQIYKNYLYESTSSPDLDDHFDEFVKSLEAFFEGRRPPLLEIGANDGLLLKKFFEAGFKDLAAIDPSPQTSKIAIPNAQIVNDFFCEESISSLGIKKFGAVIANNCFSHIPDMLTLLSRCKGLLTEQGIVVIEIQSVLDLLENLIFDYIYHEHYFYHSITSLENLMNQCGLEIFRVEHYPTKGGSYRVYIAVKGAYDLETSVRYWKYREQLAQIHQAETWNVMKNYLEKLKQRIVKILDSSQRPIFAYGACATGTVLMHYMQLERKIEYIVDDNPRRQRRFSPGCGHQVVSLDEAKSNEFCIVLAWRHHKLISKNLLRRNIDFMIPLPFENTFEA